MSMYLKKEQERYSRREPTFFEDLESVAMETGRRAIHLYAHLRHRGHEQLPAFIAAFGEFVGGHPNSLAMAARLMEKTVRYKGIAKSIANTYSVADTREHHERRAAEILSVGAVPVASVETVPRGFLSAFRAPVSIEAPQPALSPILADVEDIKPFLESIEDEFQTRDTRSTVAQEQPRRHEEMRTVNIETGEAFFNSTEGLVFMGEGKRSLVG